MGPVHDPRGQLHKATTHYPLSTSFGQMMQELYAGIVGGQLGELKRINHSKQTFYWLGHTRKTKHYSTFMLS